MKHAMVRCVIQKMFRIRYIIYNFQADPEIQAILADPQFRLTLNKIQENPAKLME